MALIDDFDGKMAFDLYCGTGTISQVLALKAKHVVGVELVEEGILEATFYCPTGGREAVDYVLRILSGEDFEDKRVILDPYVIEKEDGK